MADAQHGGEHCPECGAREQEERDLLLAELRERHVKLMRVFDALPEQGSTTADDIALELGIEQQHARAHLGRLRKIGLAKSAGGKPRNWSRT